jgi:YbgC/YbaW family acyl-CoA thioester hydrolase
MTLNLLWRNLKVYWDWKRQHKQFPPLLREQSSELKFKVKLWDCDINLHINNSVYLQYMDLGRLDWTLKTGVYQHMTKNKVSPVVVSVTIDYKKSLLPGQPFKLSTRLVEHSTRKIIFEQVFHNQHNETVAVARVVGVLLKNGSVVTLTDYLPPSSGDIS